MDRLTVSAFARTTKLNTPIRGAMLLSDSRILPTSHRGIEGGYSCFIAPRLIADGGTVGGGLGSAWMTQPDGFNDGAVAVDANRTVEVHERDVSRSRIP